MGDEAKALTGGWRPCWKRPIQVEYREQQAGDESVSTREGLTPLKADDLIIRGVQGECYPIGREIFNATYTTEPPAANARAEAAEAEAAALRDALDYTTRALRLVLAGLPCTFVGEALAASDSALAPGAGERVAEKYAAAVALADAHVRAQECSKAYIHERDKKGKRGAKREARLEELAEADLDACEAVERALDTYRAALDALDGGMR